MANARLTLEIDVDELLDALADVATRMDDITARLDRIERRQELLTAAVQANTINDINFREAIVADFSALHAEVEANGDAVDSAIVLLTDLSTRLADAADDPAEIRAIAESLSAQSDALAAAVVANTPAAPEPTPEPEPTEPEPEA